jgi:hypothetical protein
MTDRDFDRNRNGQMDWRGQSNGYRGQERFGDRGGYGGWGGFEGQGEFGNQGFGNQGQFGSQGMGGYGGWGGQGYSNQGHFPNQFGGQVGRGYGHAFNNPGMGWQQGRFGGWGQGQGQFGGWGGGFGQGWGQSQFGGHQGGWGQGQFGGQGFGGSPRLGRGGAGFIYEDIWLIPGPFTGRGPQGYQRGNDRIEEDVCERLTQHGGLDASNIQVNVDNGEVTLSGTVDSRQDKRMAEDLTESVAGVNDVHNHLRIQQSQGQAGQMGQQGQAGAGSATGQTRAQTASRNQTQRTEPEKAGATRS